MARIAIFLACFLLSASPAWAQAKSSIEKLNAEWMAAFNKGDAKALAAMYTPDAYVLPAGAEMAKGHNAIEKFWGGARNRHVQLQDKSAAAGADHRQICRRVAEDGRAVAARHRHLEHEQVAARRDNGAVAKAAE